MKSSLFRRLLLYNVLILLVPIWVGSFIHVKTVKVVAEKSSQAHMASLKRSTTILDERLGEVERLALQILTNDRVRRLSAVTDSSRNINVYLASQILTDFAQHRGMSAFVSDFYVYLPESDTILTSTAKLDADLFYEAVYALDGETVETWRHRLLTDSIRGSYLRGAMTFDPRVGPSRKYLAFVRGISYRLGAAPDAVAVVLVEEGQLTPLLENIAGTGEAYIYDDTGYRVAGTGASEAPVSGESPEGDEATVVRMPSAVTDWVYVSVTPRQAVNSAIRSVRLVTVAVTLISLILGLAVAYLMARRSYGPIRRASERLAAYTENSAPTHENELEYIGATISATIEQDRELKNRLAQQRGEMRQVFLARLLSGRAGTHALVSRNFAFFGIELLSDRFLVVLVQLESTDQPERALAGFIARGLVEETAGRHSSCFTVEMPDGTLGAIVNVGEEIDTPDAIEEIRIALEEVGVVMNAQYHTGFRASAGALRHGPDGIRESYLQARETLRYHQLNGEHPILFHSQIVGGDRDYHYPMDVERALINAAETGDLDRVNELLDEVFSENFVQRRLSTGVLQVLFFEIMGTAVRVLKRARGDLEDIFGTNFDPMEELLSCQSVGEMLSMVKHIYNSLCHYTNRLKKSHNAELKDQVDVYIESNHDDRNFSQSAMAESLGVTASYLSHFFNEQFGQHMVHYVNRRRVAGAQSLLARDRDLSIAQVAALVGCYSDKALIRIFKKYEGVTPGRYRDTVPVSGAERHGDSEEHKE